MFSYCLSSICFSFLTLELVINFLFLFFRPKIVHASFKPITICYHLSNEKSTNNLCNPAHPSLSCYSHFLYWLHCIDTNRFFIAPIQFSVLNHLFILLWEENLLKIIMYLNCFNREAWKKAKHLLNYCHYCHWKEVRLWEEVEVHHFFIY